MGFFWFLKMTPVCNNNEHNHCGPLGLTPEALHYRACFPTVLIFFSSSFLFSSDSAVCRKLHLFEEVKNLSLLDGRERERDDRERITAPLSSPPLPLSTNDNCVELITESRYNRCGSLHLGKAAYLMHVCLWEKEKKWCVCDYTVLGESVCDVLCVSDWDHRKLCVCHMLTKPYMLLNSTQTLVTTLYHRLL